jgi:LmbE family N-acetylglucosaminyl deacetylase
VTSKRTLLAVLAHPDDESFGMGGTLALYAANGVEVHLLCATKGEVGEVTPELIKGFDSIASLRTAELNCAAGILGLSSVGYLGFRDSGMAGSPDNENPDALVNQPIEKVAIQIVESIRRLRPQIVVTFDPIGGYRHPDHIAIHKATVMAFQLAGNDKVITGCMDSFQPEKLFFHTFPREFLRKVVKVLKIIGKDPSKFGRNGDIDLESFADEDFPIHVTIDIQKYREQKEKAGNCHASQGGGGMGGGILGYFLRLFNNSESFMQAYPPITDKIKPNHDLFE